jgi:hypothetical protein
MVDSTTGTIIPADKDGHDPVTADMRALGALASIEGDLQEQHALRERFERQYARQRLRKQRRDRRQS